MYNDIMCLISYAAVDYCMNTTFTVILEEGMTSVELPVCISDDLYDETEESFSLVLAAAAEEQGLIVNSEVAIVTIVDNDGKNLMYNFVLLLCNYRPVYIVSSIGLERPSYTVDELEGCVEVCVTATDTYLQREIELLMTTFDGDAEGEQYPPVEFQMCLLTSFLQLTVTMEPSTTISYSALTTYLMNTAQCV